MDKLSDFKDFVKTNPSLIKYVKNNEMTWQKFYELFDLYGNDSNVWGDYINNKTISNTTKAIGFTDLIGWIKNIDLDSFQENINSIQRVVGVLQDFGTKDTKKTDYKPRPIYKHFED